jgi:hypothetical protein
MHEKHLFGNKSHKVQRESHGSHEFPFLKKLSGQLIIQEFENNIYPLLHSMQVELEHY